MAESSLVHITRIYQAARLYDAMYETGRKLSSLKSQGVYCPKEALDMAQAEYTKAQVAYDTHCDGFLK